MLVGLAREWASLLPDMPTIPEVRAACTTGEHAAIQAVPGLRFRMLLKHTVQRSLPLSVKMEPSARRRLQLRLCNDNGLWHSGVRNEWILS